MVIGSLVLVLGSILFSINHLKQEIVIGIHELECSGLRNLIDFDFNQNPYIYIWLAMIIVGVIVTLIQYIKSNVEMERVILAISYLISGFVLIAGTYILASTIESIESLSDVGECLILIVKQYVPFYLGCALIIIGVLMGIKELKSDNK